MARRMFSFEVVFTEVNKLYAFRVLQDLKVKNKFIF